MEKNNWIKNVRHYLDEPHMSHLHSLSHKTEDVEELKGLLSRAISLNNSYIHDAKTYLIESDKL